jgi:hypothetical protein
MPFFIQAPPQVEIPKTRIEFVESDVTGKLYQDSFDPKTFNLDEDFTKHVFFKAKFEALFNAWEANTMFLSSVSKIIEDDNFQNIVKMGESVVPLIINEIEKEPSTLVWALNLITGKNIQSNQRLTVTEACKKWVKAFKSSNR